MPALRHKVAPLAIVITLLIATFAAYWRVHEFEFVDFDDKNYLLLEPRLQDGLTWRNAGWAFTGVHFSNWHPLTTLVYLTEREFFGLDAGRYHVVNLVLHAANGALLFAVLRRLTGTTWRSGFVAGLFALHPLHVESVAWVSELKDVLSAFFWLLTMLAYAAYARTGSRRSYALVVLFLLLGLLSKPMVVTLPFVLLLLDFWPLGRLRGSGEGGRIADRLRPVLRLVLEKIPLFALVLISSVPTFLAQRAGGALSSLEALPLQVRIANATLSYVRYLGKMFWPDVLAAFYPLHRESGSLSSWPLALMLLLVITTLLIWQRRRRPYLLTGWFWYLGTLVPVIGIVQVGLQAMADRYTYIPLIGPFIMISWGAGEVVARWPRVVRLAAVAAGIVLVACFVRTWQQVGVWRNSGVLFEAMLETVPDNHIARFYYGQALYQRGQFADAASQFRAATELSPKHHESWMNLGLCEAELGRPEQAMAAMAEALRLIKIERREADSQRLIISHAGAHYNLGRGWFLRGDLDKAVAHLKEGVAINPSDASIHVALAAVYQKQQRFAEAAESLRQAVRRDPRRADAHQALGHALMSLKQWDAAAEHFAKAVSLNPSDRDSQFQLGLTMLQRGKLDEAASHFAEMLKSEPESARLHFQVGVVAQTRGDDAGAVVAYRNALRLDPRSSARNNLAWLLATTPDAQLRNGGEAVRLAESMRQERGDVAEVLDTLAAAYAEAGDFERAVATAEQAIAAARPDSALAGELRQRLALYKQRKPYREQFK
jgi:tetratricopeptide (TPR) repeat protein